MGFLLAAQLWGFSDQQTSYPAWDTRGSEEIVWFLWMQQFETLTFLTNNFCQHLPVWRCEGQKSSKGIIVLEMPLPYRQQENLGIYVILSKPKAKYLYLDYSETFRLSGQLLFLSSELPWSEEWVRGSIRTKGTSLNTNLEGCTNSHGHLSTHHYYQAFFLPGSSFTSPF